jgi:hypothetical protein
MSARAAQRSMAVVTLVAFAVAGVSSIAVLTQVHNDPRRPHPAIGIGNAVVHPVWGDPLLVHHHKRTHHTPHSVAPPPPAAARHHKPPAHRHSLSWALIVTLGLLLTAALAVAVRMWLVRRAWRRTQRRLGVEPPEGVIGAWIWATLRFRAYRIPLPPQLSPDRAYRGEAIHDVPPNTAEPLRQLGLLVTPIAFGSHDAIADAEAVDAAWRLSMSACAEAEGSLSRFGRLRLRLVSPPPIGVEGGN